MYEYSPLNVTALRTGGPSQRGTSLMKVDLDEGPNAKPVAEQLRDILSAQAVRVIDFFREADEDGDGAVGVPFLVPELLEELAGVYDELGDARRAEECRRDLRAFEREQ